MKEATIRQRVMEECRKRKLFAFPIETGLVYGGVPDLCITGERTIWVELKWVIRWPVRDTTVVAKDLLRSAQKNWMVDYEEAGGSQSWILVRVDDSFFLFPGRVARAIGDFTRHGYEENAVWVSPVRGTHWVGFFDTLLGDTHGR